MKAVLLPSRRVVREAIVASLRHGDATIECAARALGVSVRTLQRHLARLGTSHSEMLAELRLEIACRLLAGSSPPLSEIAKFLGYANASSFSRAFARSMGVQPVAYRRRQLAPKHRRVRNRKKLSIGC